MQACAEARIGAGHFMKPWYDRNDLRLVQQVAAMTDDQARLKREQMGLFQQQLR